MPMTTCSGMQAEAREEGAEKLCGQLEFRAQGAPSLRTGAGASRAKQCGGLSNWDGHTALKHGSADPQQEAWVPECKVTRKEGARFTHS